MRDNALTVAGHSRPALIAHSAGNGARAAGAALDVGADFLEVDLWVHRGRFEVRHERRVFFRIPLLFEMWYLKLTPRRPFGLDDLLQQSAGRAGIFLDLKNGGEDAARLVREALDAFPDTRPVLASSQSWSLLRELRERCPETHVLYSVDVPEKLDLLFQVMERDTVPFGVSCRHTLLTEEVMARFRERNLVVCAWTVNDPERAVELARLGVAAIATDNVLPVSAALASL